MVAQTLSHYRILEKLGAGGMGEVYLAEDTLLGRRVAIKFLPPEAVSDGHARKRLVREARAAATLDHPNICSVFEVGEEAGRGFIVMQYVEGETLDARITRKPPDVKEALAVAAQLADALAEAHSHGITHRDIKPSNVMITSRGQAKVMDFGLAKVIPEVKVESGAETEALLSAPGAVLGTVPYMSPEQVRGEPVDGRSDIFSLGVVLYEMLSGQQPFASKSAAATASAILTHEPPPLARYAKEVPAELERIVGKALRKDPDQRYQTARDLLIDLESLRNELEFQSRLERSAPPEGSGGAKSVAVSSPPVTVGTAEQLTAQTTIEDGEPTREWKKESVVISPWKRTSSWVVVLAALVVAAAAGWFFWRNANVKWATEQVPRIEQLAQAGKYFEAYDAAIAVQKYLPSDPTISRLMPTISDTLTVTTEPAGARVYLRRFAASESGTFPPRELVGTTPVKDQRIARGQYVLSIEKEGYATTERTVSGAILGTGTLFILPRPLTVEQKLFEVSQMPESMAFVPGGDYRLVAWARPTEKRVRLEDFFIDKYEVSNREYKEFINAGGYLKKQYWQHPFVKDGRELSWEEATAEFKDRTGLPGPREWSNQDFPEGKGEHPVTDITWYEAAAYAAFRGKRLPTVFQWEKAARDGNVSPFTSYMPWGIFYPGDTLRHRANFDNDGPWPVGAAGFGMSSYGGYNMAGNVSEWTSNETSQGYIATGGAWGDPNYTFARYGHFPGFYNSNKMGFRCALDAPGATGDQGGARLDIKDEIPVYAPSSEADFAAWRDLYRYHQTPLDAQIVEVEERPEWRREKITFNGADGERAIAYLYLPKNFPRPLQVLHFVPAADVESGRRSLPASLEDRIAPFIKSGRAAFGVVVKGYIERIRPENYVRPEQTAVEYREEIVNRITDVRRGLDYLETRSDLDSSRVAFFGLSAGARIGLILAAIEGRYRSVFLGGSGVVKSDLQTIAGANPINFAPHIRPPKLMMLGRYDEDTPLKTQAEPLFKLLRGPKRLVLYDGPHVPPPEFLVPAMNNWLDETLGPVKRE